MADRDTLTPEEEEVTEISETEQDREKVRMDTGVEPPGEPAEPGPREDVDMDDTQTKAASSRPLI